MALIFKLYNLQAETLYYIILGVVIADFLFDTLLDTLNAKHFDDPIPAELTDVYDDEKYEKSQQYKKERFKFGLLSSGFSVILTILFLVFEGFAAVDVIAREFSSNPIVIALIFFGIIIIGSVNHTGNCRREHVDPSVWRYLHGQRRGHVGHDGTNEAQQGDEEVHGGRHKGR